tara:strand:- start:119 stop:310 length:192 start_codon:yes stop_codon:yes gene_type:complete
MSSSQEDLLVEIYYEIEEKGLRKKFNLQIGKMKKQKKNQYKNISERWEYALYRIKGGKSQDKY